VSELKNGSRLKSQVDDTQVIVVKWTESLTELRCGGHPMVALDESSASLNFADGLSGGTRMGKRYVDGGGGEVLITKAGVGTLTIGDVPLTIKEARPLPASD
jgi:hypothetical protein